MDCHIYIKTFFFLSAEGHPRKASETSRQRDKGERITDQPKRLGNN